MNRIGSGMKFVDPLRTPKSVNSTVMDERTRHPKRLAEYVPSTRSYADMLRAAATPAEGLDSKFLPRQLSSSGESKKISPPSFGVRALAFMRDTSTNVQKQYTLASSAFFGSCVLRDTDPHIASEMKTL